MRRYVDWLMRPKLPCGCRVNRKNSSQLSYCLFTIVHYNRGWGSIDIVDLPEQYKWSFLPTELFLRTNTTFSSSLSLPENKSFTALPSLTSTSHLKKPSLKLENSGQNLGKPKLCLSARLHRNRAPLPCPTRLIE